MKKHNCENCRFRAKYDTKPKSYLGRLWRWHVNWCPGWNRYMTSLPQQERNRIANTYQMKKYL